MFQDAHIPESSTNIVCFVSRFNPDQLYQRNVDFVAKINNVQKSWKAVHYPEYETMTMRDMVRRAGGVKSRVLGWDVHLFENK